VILLALTLLGIAVADLLRWSPETASERRIALAAAGSAGLTVGVAVVSGLPASQIVPAAAFAVVALAVWLLFDRLSPRSSRPGYPLAWMTAVLLAACAASGSFDGVAGPLGRWYSDLPFGFVDSVSIDRFLLAIGAGLFLLASSNRIVRLVLDAAGTPAVAGEATLRGGRLLGPMERLVVGAMVVAGNPAAAALVIAAKGLLRLPEIRDRADERRGQEDQVTEYFLIGTFSSLLLAGGMSLLVLAAS
jgi:hypothetical protein